jgi:hypothetical protein
VDEINGQHGFACACATVDDSCMTRLEILPQGVEQFLPANTRNLGWNHYLAGDFLHETISNLEAEDKRGGLRNS